MILAPKKLTMTRDAGERQIFAERFNIHLRSKLGAFPPAVGLSSHCRGLWTEF